METKDKVWNTKTSSIATGNNSHARTSPWLTPPIKHGKIEAAVDKSEQARGGSDWDRAGVFYQGPLRERELRVTPAGRQRSIATGGTTDAALSDSVCASVSATCTGDPAAAAGAHKSSGI